MQQVRDPQPMRIGDGAGMAFTSSTLPLSSSAVETDMTCQSFAQWLTELRSKNSRTLHEMLSEMHIIRDGITSNNMELSEFKRGSTNISQQMQGQLTDLREKLTNAFSEITALVKAKTVSDQEMMQDINSLQQTISVKTQELEALMRSYSQAHSSLQTSLIQIQNNLQVSNGEVQQARASCQRVQEDMVNRFSEIDTNVRTLEDDLNVGNAENRNQMLQLQEDIARIHDAIADVTAEFNDHKRATNSVHNKFQSAVWSLEEGRKRQQQLEVMQARLQPTPAREPEPVAAMLGSGQEPAASASASAPTTAVAKYQPGHPAGNRHTMPQGPPTHGGTLQTAVGPPYRPGSGQLPQMVPSMAPVTMVGGAMPTSSVVLAPTPVVSGGPTAGHQTMGHHHSVLYRPQPTAPMR